MKAVAAILVLCLFLPSCALLTAADQFTHIGENPSHEKVLDQKELQK